MALQTRLMQYSAVHTHVLISVTQLVFVFESMATNNQKAKKKLTCLLMLSTFRIGVQLETCKYCMLTPNADAPGGYCHITTFHNQYCSS